MRKERILAVIMSVLLILSMIPVTVFAAEITALDGKLKMQGTAAEGKTLSADFKSVKPEGIAEEDVTYCWERKTSENEAAEKAGEKPELKTLGKEKTYTVTKEDVGSKIVLTVTGKEENGYSGSLTVVSDTVAAVQQTEEEPKQTEEKADTAEEQNSEETTEPETSQNEEQAAEAETSQNEEQAAEPETTQEEEPKDDTEGTQAAENADEAETEEPAQDAAEDNTEIPEATTDEEKQQGEAAGSETVEGIPEAKEDGTYEQAGASIMVGDGSSDVVDFGTVIAGQEDSVQEQYVTVSNTGNTELNFEEISPEHFMVQDISNPLEQNSSQQLWIVPRAGVGAGTYEDTITYTSAEGAKVSFVAKMTVEDKAQDNESQDDQTSDTEKAPDVVPDPDTEKQPDNTDGTDSTDGTDNTDSTPKVTLAVDENVARDGLTFTSTESQTVQVTNTSEQAITVEAASASAAPAVMVSPSEKEIQPGETAEFTVTPDENLAPDTTYPDTIRFADKNNPDNEVVVYVNVTIPTPAVSRVTADETGAEFGTLVEGYTSLPEAKTITLTNEGNADADLSEAVSDSGEANGKYFNITWQAQTIAQNGGTAQFTIQPKTDLTASSYTENFTITNNSNASNSIVITATVTVEEAKHSLDVSTKELPFPTVKKGYSDVASQQFTVTNNGNVTETLEQPVMKYFNVSVDPDSLVLAPGATAVYTVRPANGLDVSTYQDEVRISSDKSVTVSFQVVKGTASLTKIHQPSAITGLPNGTKKDAASLKLPSTVVIETTEGKMKASVSWNVKAAAYKQSSTKAQKFTVAGTVKLPSGVDNNNQISLSVSVEVSVKAYSAKIASAENNKITGIDVNGVYTTQTKISFTAVGAGMDNNSPKNGDTRYVPQSWTVINTNVWNAAPYTASFGLSKSGNYTLKVVFNQQKYDGSGWKTTGETDTRQVSFSITKAKVTVPGTNLTPAANRRNAVKTGDNTPILPFVCILIIAAGAIGGVVFYKKKNKK